MCCLKTKVYGCFTAIILSIIFQGSTFKRFHFVKRIFLFFIFYQMAVCNDNSASTYQNGNARNGTDFSNINVELISKIKIQPTFLLDLN